jgi:hypothetical protein
MGRHFFCEFAPYQIQHIATLLSFGSTGEETMARKSTRTTARKTTRRTLDPTKLPYAEEARTASETIDFLFNRLPDFIAREFATLR